ncbi:DoxX family protein [Halorubrum sp. 2020YC2]|uniref:DoxX family protein n=1 Tax=Halorubrum sp. 2020YC2 TaxID=2836432 RepID=UPI001BE8A922|nr:DoxX family protein [Halorubrum sp. 2020YC2]QWC19928.1 DoxX family protein [Halorubrum sp. 2020YC2]
MSYQSSNPLVGETEFALEGPWATYWIAFLRVVTGWWFFHAGITKVIENGFSYTYGSAYMSEMSGTALGGIPVWMGNNLAWLIEPGVPLFETLIGLALMAGAVTRLAAFGGVIFMVLFWIGNAGFTNGVVNSDLMGLLLFLTVIVLAAGRYYGLDALVEETEFVKQHPKLRYLLG